MPACRKFLRMEHHHAENLRRMALRHFDGILELKHSGRTVSRWDATTVIPWATEQRLSKVSGGRFGEHSIHIEHAAAGLRLVGWIGLPASSRTQADLQYFCVAGAWCVIRCLHTRGVKLIRTSCVTVAIPLTCGI